MRKIIKIDKSQQRKLATILVGGALLIVVAGLFVWWIAGDTGNNQQQANGDPQTNNGALVTQTNSTDFQQALTEASILVSSTNYEDIDGAEEHVVDGQVDPPIKLVKFNVGDSATYQVSGEYGQNVVLELELADLPDASSAAEFEVSINGEQFSGLNIELERASNVNLDEEAAKFAYLLLTEELELSEPLVDPQIEIELVSGENIGMWGFSITRLTT